jgi:hypothetical protein
VERVFERFTERARQVVVLAQDEARALRHNYIGTEHILLGLLREEEGLAARVLESLDVTVEEVRAQVAAVVGEGDDVTTGQIPFTPRAKKVLELSLREALGLGHNYIGTEHVLLGLVRVDEGVAARILLDFGLDAEKIRDELIRMLSGPGRRAEGSPPPGYVPKSPPLAPEFVAELERVRAEKELAIEAQEFERGASARDRERRLAAAARAVERVWEGQQPEPEFGYSPMAHAPPTPVTRSRETFPPAFFAGWLSFAAALAVGVLVGWLIWG